MGLGPGEIVLILVIAYVVVGPEDMSKLARMLAKGLRELRKLRADLHAEVEESVPLKELAAEVGNNGSPDPSSMKTAKDSSLSRLSGEMSEELESVMKEIQRAEEELASLSGHRRAK